MNEKVLFTVSTSFQLLVAVQLKKQYFYDDYVDIIITDYTKNYVEMAKRLEETNLFNAVYYAHVREFLYQKRSIKKVFNYISAFICPQKILARHCSMINYEYDRFLFFNINMFTQLFYEKLKSENGSLKCERFEEGFNIYLRDDRSDSASIALKNKLGKNTVVNSISTIYLFHPELIQYPLSVSIKTIGSLSIIDQGAKEKLNYVFGYEEDALIDSSKIFYFEGSYYSNCDSEADINLLDSISEVAGKSRICVKLHPRSLKNRFETYGYHTLGNSSVPWELVQMNHDFSDKIFITVSSASILASSLYFADNIESIFLYECMSELPPDVDAIYKKYINDIKVRFNANNLVIPFSKYELIEKIKKELN